MDTKLAKAQRSLICVLVLFAVLALFPYVPDPSGDIKTLGCELCAFAAFTFWLFTPRRWGEVLRRSSGLFPLLLLFLGVNLAAAFESVNIGYSLSRELPKWVSLFVLFLVVADTFRTPRQIWFLIGVLCVSVSVASLYGFVQYLGMDPFPWKDTTGMLRSAPASFGNPNFASHVLVLTLILAVGLLTQRRGRWVVVCIPLFLGHFALTRTRGSLLALGSALVLVFLVWFFSRNSRGPSRAIAAAMAALFLFGALGLASVLVTTKAKTGQLFPYDRGVSIALRYHSFYGACQMVQDRPWLGYGPGMYQVMSPQYWTPLEKERFNDVKMLNDHVHNEPLEIAADAGIAGAATYLAFLVTGLFYGLFLGLVSNDPERRSLGMALGAFFLAFLLDGFFGFNVHVPVSALLLFLMAGATEGMWRSGEAPQMQTGSPNLPRGWFPISWRVALVGCAAIIPVLAVRDFSAGFYHHCGTAMVHRDDYVAAAQYFRKAAHLAPYAWTHHYDLGVSTIRAGHLEEGVDHLARTIELNPSHIGAMIEMAQALFSIAASSSMEQGEAILRQAVHHAERAAQFNFMFPEVHDLLGRASSLRAKWLTDAGGSENLGAAEDAWAEAEQYLGKAIEFGAKNKHKLYELIATARSARGDELGAQRALALSIEDNRSEVRTWQLLLSSCRKTGQYDVIRISLDRCLSPSVGSQMTEDELSTLELMRAKVLHEGYADTSGAEDAFLRVVKRSPARVDAWAAFYAFCKSVGREARFRESILEVAAGQQEGTEHALPPQVRAVALGLKQDEGSIVEGATKLVEALQQHQGVSQTQEETADAFRWAVDALAASAAGMSLAPKDTGDVFLKLGLVYGACQEFDAAIQSLDRALPNLTGAQWLLCLLRKGAALSVIGNTKAAVDAFAQAAASDPTSFEARHGLAQALAEDGQMERARVEYKLLLSNFQTNAEGRAILEQELAALQD